jgi:hypothetical protein
MMYSFKATIDIIGVNPFVFLPDRVLNSIFTQSGKNKGPIPVQGAIDGHPYKQTLVRYSGAWRLYINGPMLKASGRKVGDKTTITIAFDPEERSVPMHPKLEVALKSNKKAKEIFDQLPPSRQKEIIRYISYLKTEASVDKNVERAMQFLTGKEKFVGRDRP